jgi:hypothetical protein
MRQLPAGRIISSVCWVSGDYEWPDLAGVRLLRLQGANQSVISVELEYAAPIRPSQRLLVLKKHNNRRRLVKARKGSPQVKRLKTRVRDLKNKLADSVSKTELESLKTTLEAKIRNLEAKLVRSVPKEEVDALQASLKERESRLPESIPRREAEAQLESTRTEPRKEIDGLKEKLSASKAETDSLRADSAQLRDKLAASVPKAKSEAKVDEPDEALGRQAGN